MALVSHQFPVRCHMGAGKGDRRPGWWAGSNGTLYSTRNTRFPERWRGSELVWSVQSSVPLPPSPSRVSIKRASSIHDDSLKSCRPSGRRACTRSMGSNSSHQPQHQKTSAPNTCPPWTGYASLEQQLGEEIKGPIKSFIAHAYWATTIRPSVGHRSQYAHGKVCQLPSVTGLSLSREQILTRAW